MIGCSKPQFESLELRLNRICKLVIVFTCFRMSESLEVIDLTMSSDEEETTMPKPRSAVKSDVGYMGLVKHGLRPDGSCYTYTLSGTNDGRLATQSYNHE